MSYRYMRVLVLFDLPMVSAQERRIYSKFRKYLLKNGFLMMQESVYTKLALNATVANAIMERVRDNKPPQGLIQMLTVTERQFARMELVLGEYRTEIIDDERRLVIL